MSGQLARAWDPRPEPYEAVCLAAEQHDVGMAQWDLTPTLNPATGLPTTFIEMDLDTHVRLWSAAPARLLTQSRYAALLVSLHGSRLYALRDLDAMDEGDADQIRAWEATQCVFRARLIGQLGADPEVLRAQQALMWCWDSLSLGLLLGWETFTVEGITLRDGAVLDPWPLSVAVLTVVCDGAAPAEAASTTSRPHARGAGGGAARPAVVHAEAARERVVLMIDFDAAIRHASRSRRRKGPRVSDPVGCRTRRSGRAPSSASSRSFFSTPPV